MFERACLISIAMSVAGCAGGNALPSAATDSPPSKTAPIGAAAAPPAGVAAPAIAVSKTPSAPAQTIPANARFSIFCESYSSPDHVQFSTNVKNLLIKNTKLKDWYIIHEASQSSLYHGYYAETDPNAAGDNKAAKRDADRAQRDRAMIESIPNPTAPDRKMFPRSLIVPLDAPDPDAPPAWNLTNAKGYWTVQVAAFTGGDRKRQAVEAVRQARAMSVEAYYYHGEAVSSVCVGSWEQSALKKQDVAEPGKQGSDAKARDDGSSFVVDLTGHDLPDAQKHQRGPDGKPIRVLQAKIEVLDPTLMKTLNDYPEQAVDGYAVMLNGTDKQGHPVTRPRPSMIVMIPRGENAPGNAAAPQVNEPTPTLLNPNGGGQSLGARLKGIGQ